MPKSNADFSKLVSSKKYVLTPTDSESNNSSGNRQNNESQVSDLKRQEKKRKRAERKKKYFDRKKAAKEKERAQKEEEEFAKQLNAKLSKSENNKNFEDLPEEYRKLIGADFEYSHTFKGLDYKLLRQTKDKIAKQQIEDIESAYNDTNNLSFIHNNNNNNNDNDNKPLDEDGDISMIMDIKSLWAHNIHKSVMKYYCNNDKKLNKKKIKINPKFSNGMYYCFNLDSNTSRPTEIMRSQIGYGLVLDDFNEFENDNMSNTLCIGYTPINTINKIKNALNNTNKIQKPKQKQNDDNDKVSELKQGQKRTFSEMSEVKNDIDSNDFDIFEDVGHDYVCDTNPKRIRVSFMTPRMEEINQLKQSYFENSNENFIKNSNVKHAAASILKSSLNKAKLENLKVKRKMKMHQDSLIPGMPTLEKGKDKKKNNENSLRGKLLSSGFASYDDDDDDDYDEDMNSYNSDEDDKCKKTITAASADAEWKQMREKFGESGENTSDSVKQKLNKSGENTPSLAKLFSN